MMKSAADFAIANAPPAWKQAYRRAFTPGHPAQTPENVVEIKNLDFDGTCAVIDVTIDGLAQLRAYCLQATQWRRAPIPATAWDEWQTLTVRPALQIRFAARDRDFAQTLATDTAKLLDQVEAYWPYETETEILIEPHDLQPPLISSDRGRIRQADIYRLYHYHPQRPNQPPTLLLEGDRSFWPLGC